MLTNQLNKVFLNEKDFYFMKTKIEKWFQNFDFFFLDGARVCCEEGV
jgi:hypothetical protein